MKGYKMMVSLRFRKGLSSTFNSIRRKSTIYAVSSGYGKCGVAIIRVSGPKASEVIFNIGGLKSLPQPRYAKLCKLKDPISKEILDRGLLLWFPGPKSFSGEDICELHVHGGQAVVSSVLTALSKLPTFQPAEPGEFTRRAFHAGKMDLTEVEGLGDLLSAETEVQRKQAFLQMEGALSSLYSSWRQILIKCVAHLEAFIDFSEDENIEEGVLIEANSVLLDLEKDIQNHIYQSKCGERLREGVRTVLIGEPNVGKSSLLNILCKRPAAIVTPIAGTTRDIVELHMNFNGYPIILADTAGLHSKSKDEIEIEGMTRAKTFASSADLILFVGDSTDCIDNIVNGSINFETYIHNYLMSLDIKDLCDSSINHMLVRKRSISHFGNKDLIENQNLRCFLFVLNKSDLVKTLDPIEEIIHNFHNVVFVSCKTNVGINNLQDKITDSLTDLCGKPTLERPNFTQARHRYHISQCLQQIQEYFTIYNSNGDYVLAAQKLRNALRQIGKITGHVNAEQILDVIFKDFCIGK